MFTKPIAIQRDGSSCGDYTIKMFETVGAYLNKGNDLNLRIPVIRSMMSTEAIRDFRRRTHSKLKDMKTTGYQTRANSAAFVIVNVFPGLLAFQDSDACYRQLWAVMRRYPALNTQHDFTRTSFRH